MLKGINPILTGDLLQGLDKMGHADQLAIVDRNYPAYSAGPTVIHVGQVQVTELMSAVLSVFPLDSFIDNPLLAMQSNQKAGTSIQRQVFEIASDEHRKQLNLTTIDRFAFYDQVKSSALIIQCLETAPYSCFILQKGVV